MKWLHRKTIPIISKEFYVHHYVPASYILHPKISSNIPRGILTV